MKKMELYERISSMSADYSKFAGKYTEEAGVEVLNKYFKAEVEVSEHSAYTGYVPLIAWMRYVGKSYKNNR